MTEASCSEMLLALHGDPFNRSSMCFELHIDRSETGCHIRLISYCFSTTCILVLATANTACLSIVSLADDSFDETTGLFHIYMCASVYLQEI